MKSSGRLGPSVLGFPKELEKTLHLYLPKRKRKTTPDVNRATSSHGLSLSQARDRAYEILGKVSTGKDPAKSDSEKKVSTVKELIEMFLKIQTSGTIRLRISGA